MTRRTIFTTGAIALALVAVTAAFTPGPTTGMRVGAPEFKSLGQLAFGPGNVLFIGDNDGAQVLAVDVPDNAAGTGAINVEGLDAKIAQVLGAAPADIRINDMAVHPASKNVYVTVTRGNGDAASSVLLRVSRNAAKPIEEVSLANVKFSNATIANAPAAAEPGARRNPRTSTITDMEFAEGALWVAGLSNEEFASSFRRFAYPFVAGAQTTTVEIYHVSHRASETRSPVTSFTVRRINGAPYIVAGYTCTPIVAFPISDLQPGKHVVGRTVAELGAGNTPTDLVPFTRDGKDVIMVVNNRRPLMRIMATDVATGEALKAPDLVGIARTPLDAPTGVSQMSDLDANFVVAIQRGANGVDLKSIAKSSL